MRTGHLRRACPGRWGHLTNDDPPAMVWLSDPFCPWGCPLDPRAIGRHPWWKRLWRKLWNRS